MKHLQADLSTYSHRYNATPPRHASPPTPQWLDAVTIYTYDSWGAQDKVTTSTHSFKAFLSMRIPLATFVADLDRHYTTPQYSPGMLFRISHAVVTLDKLEAWTAYFLEHPSSTSNIMYKQCLDAFPEYFL